MSAWARARDVLAVRLDAMGDVLMTSPALRALKQSTPGRRVTLLTSTAGAAVAALIPEVDEVIVYDPPWMKATAPCVDSAVDRAMIERLGGRFDAAAIFTVYSQNPLPAALLCFLAGIPLRLAHCHENPYQLLTDWVRDPEPDEHIRHEVERQLALVAVVGACADNDRLSLAVPPDASRRAARRLRGMDIGPGRRYIALHPGASAPSRRYPVESFAEVAKLLDARGERLVVIAGPGEAELAAELIARVGSPHARLLDGLPLAELAATIAQAAVLITNNSGPAHIAAAVGTPVVDLYALTNPQHTPWRVPHRVLFHDVPCKFCYRSVCPEGHHACLRRVAPERVVAAADELLEAGTQVSRTRVAAAR
jgi:lipopolysaccharide heptosyltransferase II